MTQTIENEGPDRSAGGQKPINSVIGPNSERKSFIELALWGIGLSGSAVAVCLGWRPPEWVLMVAAGGFGVVAVVQIQMALRAVRDADRVYWRNVRNGGGK